MSSSPTGALERLSCLLSVSAFGPRSHSRLCMSQSPLSSFMCGSLYFCPLSQFLSVFFPLLCIFSFLLSDPSHSFLDFSVIPLLGYTFVCVGVVCLSHTVSLLTVSPAECDCIFTESFIPSTRRGQNTCHFIKTHVQSYKDWEGSSSCRNTFWCGACRRINGFSWGWGPTVHQVAQWKAPVFGCSREALLGYSLAGLLGNSRVRWGHGACSSRSASSSLETLAAVLWCFLSPSTLSCVCVCVCVCV